MKGGLFLPNFVFLPLMNRYLAFVLLCCALAPAWAQESVAEIRRTLKSVEQETAREKELTVKEAKRHADFVETSRKKTAALAQQESSVRNQLDSMRAEIARLHDARQKATGGSRWYEGRKARYAEQLAQMIDSLAPVLESDFPYKNDEAVQAVRETSSQLRKGVIAPDEALGRVLELMLDRIRLGYTSETWSGYLAFEGRSIPGKFLRFGAVASLFVSQNGDEVLWLSQQNGSYEWKSAGDQLELRTALKDAMKVAEGKTPPRLVTLPLVSPLQGGAQ